MNKNLPQKGHLIVINQWQNSAKKRNISVNNEFKCPYCEYEACFKYHFNKHVAKCESKHNDSKGNEYRCMKNELVRLDMKIEQLNKKIEGLEKLINHPQMIAGTNNINGLPKKTMAEGYIYLIQEREFVNKGEEVYKFGKTKTRSAHARIKQYPKNSVLFYTEAVKNCDETETLLLTEFGKKFKRRSDIGREYFEGNIGQILTMIKNFVPKDQPITEFNTDLKELSQPLELYKIKENDEDEKELSRSLELQFIIEFLNELKEDITIAKKEVFIKFTNFLSKIMSSPESYKVNGIRFGLQLKKMNINGFTSSKDKRNYVINKNQVNFWLIKNKYIEEKQ